MKLWNCNDIKVNKTSGFILLFKTTEYFLLKPQCNGLLKAFLETKNSPSKLFKVAHKDRCSVHVTSGEICQMVLNELNELYLIFICTSHSNQRPQS